MWVSAHGRKMCGKKILTAGGEGWGVEKRYSGISSTLKRGARHLESNREAGGWGSGSRASFPIALPSSCCPLGQEEQASNHHKWPLFPASSHKKADDSGRQRHPAESLLSPEQP